LCAPKLNPSVSAEGIAPASPIVKQLEKIVLEQDQPVARPERMIRGRRHRETE